MLKYYRIFFIMFLIACFFIYPASAQETLENIDNLGNKIDNLENKTKDNTEKKEPEQIEKQPAPAKPLSVDDILSKIENRYDTSGFTAVFSQTSVIKAMDITDTAQGKVFIKRPKMMRWEYETPEKQIILTNGDGLWVFRPDDNQVMAGSAPVYFGDGKGASFLSDIRLIRRKYNLSLEKSKEPENYKLKLIPMEKNLDISRILLWVSKENFNVIRIATYNSYDDETLINMSDLHFNRNIDDSVFSIKIPDDADVVSLD